VQPLVSSDGLGTTGPGCTHTSQDGVGGGAADAPLVAHCYLGLGTVYRRTAKREQGHERLTTATTTYREIDMRFWLEHAATEMGA